MSSALATAAATLLRRAPHHHHRLLARVVTVAAASQPRQQQQCVAFFSSSSSSSSSSWSSSPSLRHAHAMLSRSTHTLARVTVVGSTQPSKMSSSTTVLSMTALPLSALPSARFMVSSTTAAAADTGDNSDNHNNNKQAGVPEKQPSVEERYATPLRYMHWLVAGVTVTAVGLVLAAQQCDKDDPRKGVLMHYHKSFGLVAAALLMPRIALRLTTKLPAHLPGLRVEHWAATAGHAALYAGMVAMPATGIAMGYFGGKGLPFFRDEWKVAGAATPNGAIAKQAYKMHLLIGQAFEYAIALHLGATLLHVIRGHPILTRMWF